MRTAVLLACQFKVDSGYEASTSDLRGNSLMIEFKARPGWFRIIFHLKFQFEEHFDKRCMFAGQTSSACGKKVMNICLQTNHV